METRRDKTEDMTMNRQEGDSKRYNTSAAGEGERVYVI